MSGSPIPSNQSQSVEKRVRYFEGQSLKTKDYADEQKYHIDRQRRHNRTLHVSGICDGLIVQNKDAQIIVGAGTALNSKGQQIVLGKDSPIENLETYKNQVVKLVISYQEIESDQSTEGGRGNTRWHEKPKVQVLTESDQVPEECIFLAKLKIDSNGEVEEVDNTVRQYSGVYLPAGDGQGVTLRTHGDENPNLAILNGSLSISGILEVSGNLAVTGTSTLTGNVTANASLTVQGTTQLSNTLTVTKKATLQDDLDVTGNLKVSKAITPNYGNDENSGIVFPKNPYGRGGDEAWIRYYREGGSGEACILEIAIGNDTNDHIALSPNAGNVGIGTKKPTEKLEVAGGIKGKNITAEETVTAKTFVGEGAVIKGMILMWSGTTEDIPLGWALCNGEKGTPDLSERFIVGASSKNSEYAPKQSGAPDTHTHSLPNQNINTNYVENHTHKFPGNWYKNYVGGPKDKSITEFEVSSASIAAQLAGGIPWLGGVINSATNQKIEIEYVSVVDCCAEDVKNTTIQADGSHFHSINLRDIITEESKSHNRPNWYAICFIMKL